MPPAQPVGCVLLLNAPNPYLLATDPKEQLLYSHGVPRHVSTPASAGGVHPTRAARRVRSALERTKTLPFGNRSRGKTVVFTLGPQACTYSCLRRRRAQQVPSELTQNAAN